MLNSENALDAYQALRKEHKDVSTAINNLQRRKDYKVQKIENKFTTKIDALKDRESALSFEIKKTEDYIALNKMFNTEDVTKNCTPIIKAKMKKEEV